MILWFYPVWFYGFKSSQSTEDLLTVVSDGITRAITDLGLLQL